MFKFLLLLALVQICVAKQPNYRPPHIPTEPPKKQPPTLRFRPCRTNILEMDREETVHSTRSHNWKGTLNVKEKHDQDDIVPVVLELTASARVELDEGDGTIVAEDGAFHITFREQRGKSKKLHFHVYGNRDDPFPNVQFLSVNGENICPNPEQWNPDEDDGGGSSSAVVVIGNNSSTTTTPAPTISDPDDGRCGLRRIMHNALLTNGYPSLEGDWPWHVAIFHISSTSSSYRCGGTVISQSVVVTAGHCVTEGGDLIIPERVLVRLGLHQRLISNRNTQEFTVFRIVQHEDFQYSDLRNDIALLKLGTQVDFTAYVQPACLWPSDSTDIDNVIGQNGWVVGWGLNEADILADVLTQGQMPIVSLTTCLNSNREFFGAFLSDKNFCAGFRNGTSVCNGDSGGGLFIRRNNAFFLRGIVSLSVAREDRNVCNPEHFVLFTDVAQYLDWIQRNL